MPADRLLLGELLQYDADHKVLICRQCRYAIQKNALESHLLRHKIYRSDRRQLLSSISRLNILEPDCVTLPSPGSPPVDGLPIFSGVRCTVTGCGHLTISLKRMKLHWAEFHNPNESLSPSPNLASPVKLQTFFRGNKVRYFEVSPDGQPIVHTAIDSFDHDPIVHQESREDTHGETAISLSLQSLSPGSASTGISTGSSSTGFSLDTLRYFHHFITVTAPTLPRADDSDHAQGYWQKPVVSQALHCHWLMCGLLAISAQHLATLQDDPEIKHAHHEGRMAFALDFLAGLDKTTTHGLDVMSIEDAQGLKKVGNRIKCLLYNMQWTWVGTSLPSEKTAVTQLSSIISNLRGCMTNDSLLEHGCSTGSLDGHEEDKAARHPFICVGSASGNFLSGSSSGTPLAILDGLHALPSRMAEQFGKPESMQEVFTTLSAISTLVECCEISFAHDAVEVGWKSVATWTINVSEHFDHMISCNRSAALVVLAYWAAVLVKRAERVGCWFLQGVPRVIVLLVVEQLSANDPNSLHLIEGLVDMVND